MAWMTTTRMAGLVATAATVLAYTTATASCSDDSNTSSTDPCPSGICGTAQGGNGQGGSAQGAAGPGGNGSGAGQPSCAWVCSPWDTQGNGDAATRTCVDVDGCADASAKPPEMVTLPALSEPFYQCQIEPILDRLCAQLGCHGVEPDLAAGDPGRALRTYHRGRLRITGETLNNHPLCPPGSRPSEDCIGSIECACWQDPHTPTEWQRNFDAARGFALDPLTGAELADKSQSELLTQPDNAGGLPHAGIKIWDSSDSGGATYANYQTILDWLNGASQPTCNSGN